jgi:hypothetical protein
MDAYHTLGVRIDGPTELISAIKTWRFDEESWSSVEGKDWYKRPGANLLLSLDLLGEAMTVLRKAAKQMHHTSLELVAHAECPVILRLSGICTREHVKDEETATVEVIVAPQVRDPERDKTRHKKNIPLAPRERQRNIDVTQALLEALD